MVLMFFALVESVLLIINIYGTRRPDLPHPARPGRPLLQPPPVAAAAVGQSRQFVKEPGLAVRPPGKPHFKLSNIVNNLQYVFITAFLLL